MTWAQFEEAVLVIVALTWGTLELAFWGARPSALMFILVVLAGRQGILLWLELRRGKGS